MHGLYTLAVFLHILAAIIWLGGALFLALVVVPVIRMERFKAAGRDLIHEAGIRFRTVGWICLVTLLITGLVAMSFRGLGPEVLFQANSRQGAFAETLAMKLVLVAIVFALSGIHDFYFGPRASKALMANPEATASQTLRKQASWFGRTSVLLGLIIVYLAVSLVRGF